MKKVQLLDYRIQRKEVEIRSCDVEEDKKIAIVTHSTAMLFLLMKWCDITKEHISYNDKIIADTKVDNCDIFELIFNNNKNLINIKKVSNA